MCLNVVHSLPALDDTLVLTVLEYMCHVYAFNEVFCYSGNEAVWPSTPATGRYDTYRQSPQASFHQQTYSSG